MSACGNTGEKKASRHAGDFAAAGLQVLPIAVSVLPFALLFGALAAQKGLSPLETFLMSALVFAGSSQFVAIDLWQDPAPVLLLTGTALLVNLRHVLMGAAIVPGLKHWSPPKAYGGLFFMADEIWALSLRRANASHLSPAFYFGLAVPLYLTWISATTAGSLIGGLFSDPARYGFDFAFTAVFLVLLTSLWNGPRCLPPWLVSVLAAIVTHSLVPGAWYILAGGAAGVLVGALQGGPKDAA